MKNKIQTTKTIQADEGNLGFTEEGLKKKKIVMKLYLISQDSNNDYDTYDSCVVCAESEADARTISPDQSHPIDEHYAYTSWALTHESIRCKEIGTANENIKRGIILASFNAG